MIIRVFMPVSNYYVMQDTTNWPSATIWPPQGVWDAMTATVTIDGVAGTAKSVTATYLSAGIMNIDVNMAAGDIILAA